MMLKKKNLKYVTQLKIIIIIIIYLETASNIVSKEVMNAQKIIII